MNNYEKKSALIILGIGLLMLLWLILLYIYFLPMLILTVALPTICVLSLQILVHWEELAIELEERDKAKQQEK